MKALAYRGNVKECISLLESKGYKYDPKSSQIEKNTENKDALFATFFSIKDYVILPIFPRYEDLDNIFRGRYVCQSFEEFEKYLGKWIGNKLLILKHNK